MRSFSNDFKLFNRVASGIYCNLPFLSTNMLVLTIKILGWNTDMMCNIKLFHGFPVYKCPFLDDTFAFRSKTKLLGGDHSLWQWSRDYKSFIIILAIPKHALEMNHILQDCHAVYFWIVTSLWCKMLWKKKVQWILDSFIFYTRLIYPSCHWPRGRAWTGLQVITVTNKTEKHPRTPSIPGSIFEPSKSIQTIAEHANST